MSQTRTMATAATFAALNKALKVIGGPNGWTPRTPEHKRFLEMSGLFVQPGDGHEQYVQSFAAPTAAEINAKLKAAGLDIKLEDWPADKPSFGIAGVTDVLVNWRTAGKVSEVVADDGQQYPAFTLSNNRFNGLHQTPDGGNVVVLETQEELQVRIQMTGDPGDQLSLMESAVALHQAELERNREGYTKVKIPMVQLDQKPDVSWLLGMYVPVDDRGYWELVQAVMQTKFAMNQFGAHATEGMAGEVTFRGISVPQIYEINRPFLITIGKEGRPAPLFGAYVATADWKNPGDLQPGK